MENIQVTVDRIQEMQRQKDKENRARAKMYNILCNCLRGINNDYVNDIKTLDDYMRKNSFLVTHIWELEKRISDDKLYMNDTFKGRMGKAKKESQALYIKCLKEDEDELRKCQELKELMFFEGAQCKYFSN
jgi:hypothetical protein